MNTLRLVLVATLWPSAAVANDRASFAAYCAQMYRETYEEQVAFDKDFRRLNPHSSPDVDAAVQADFARLSREFNRFNAYVVQALLSDPNGDTTLGILTARKRAHEDKQACYAFANAHPCQNRDPKTGVCPTAPPSENDLPSECLRLRRCSQPDSLPY
jgi:hypothetical protein